MLDVLANRPPMVIAEVDECPRCRVQLAAQLALSIAGVARERDGDDCVLWFEMYRANIQYAIDDGQTETPPDGL